MPDWVDLGHRGPFLEASGGTVCVSSINLKHDRHWVWYVEVSGAVLVCTVCAMQGWSSVRQNHSFCTLDFFSLTTNKIFLLSRESELFANS